MGGDVSFRDPIRAREKEGDVFKEILNKIQGGMKRARNFARNVKNNLMIIMVEHFFSHGLIATTRRKRKGVFDARVIGKSKFLTKSF